MRFCARVLYPVLVYINTDQTKGEVIRDLLLARAKEIVQAIDIDKEIPCLGDVWLVDYENCKFELTGLNK